MQLVDDPDAASWLDGLEGAAEDFDWDEGNRAKNRKHDVDPVDVEAMFRSPLVFAGRIIARPHDEPRWLALGEGTDGRRLTLVFTRRGERLRVISCRPMRREERNIYEETVRRG